MPGAKAGAGTSGGAAAGIQGPGLPNVRVNDPTRDRHQQDQTTRARPPSRSQAGMSRSATTTPSIRCWRRPRGPASAATPGPATAVGPSTTAAPSRTGPAM
jgi:hypothetical protein